MSLVIREACEGDAEAIVELIADLGHEMTVEGVAERIRTLDSDDCPQLVACIDGSVIGLCGLQVTSPIHRPRPVGRVTVLKVAKGFQRRGIGRALMEGAEKRIRNAGCGMIELTSNERLVDAHEFYQRLGFDHTSKRFAKKL